MMSPDVLDATVCLAARIAAGPPNWLGEKGVLNPRKSGPKQPVQVLLLYVRLSADVGTERVPGDFVSQLEYDWPVVHTELFAGPEMRKTATWTTT